MSLRIRATLRRSFRRRGFSDRRAIEPASEWGEFAEETTGQGGRRLIHAARLLRAPERYIAEFGRTAYDIMLGDCLWDVYRMIGKMSPRVYQLTASAENASSQSGQGK